MWLGKSLALSLCEVSRLIRGKEKKAGGRLEVMGTFWEGKEEIPGKGKFRCTLHVLVGSLLPVLYYEFFKVYTREDFFSFARPN